MALQYTGEDQGGLLAKAEYPAALLPMSGYDQDANLSGELPHPDSTALPNISVTLRLISCPKSASWHLKLTLVFAAEYDARRPSQAYSSLTEHNARRPSQDSMYLQYALPGAADPQYQQPTTAYDRQSDHMSYGASLIYQPRASFEATSSVFHNHEPRKTLRVTSHNPDRGTKGVLVYINLESSSDLLSPTPQIATLMFATRPVPAELIRLEAQKQDVCYKYLVSAPAPAFSETRSSNLRIPLNLQLQDQSTLEVSSIDFGSWLYEDGRQFDLRSSPQQISRKRKVTDEPPDNPRSTKRAMPLEQQTIQSQGYGSYPYPSASLAYPQSPQSLPNMDLSTMQRKYTAYGRSQLQQTLQAESSTVESQGLDGGALTSDSQMRPPMGQTSSWNPSHGTGYHSARNRGTSAAPSFQFYSVSGPGSANPQLVRSSTLAPQPNSGTASAGCSSDGTFNPYTLYPNRAVLQIRGNLEAMHTNWTPEEHAAKRRIVRFWREQNGTTLTARFRPVIADEQPLPHETNESRISCIYWEERNEYYVTSVDTIALLESLVGTRFEVAEKNRIRRNLEGYKPCTISKGKPESESFFKIIMGFPNPKPRVIEKDVKVFRWSILEQALKKIISKYVCSISLVKDNCNTNFYQSADPSSTAGPLQRQRSSNFRGSQSETGASRHSALSSRSTSGSTASGPYTQTIKSSTLSPRSISHGLPSYSQASPLQQFPASSLSHSYTIPTLDSQYIPNDISNSPYTTQVSIPSLSSAYTASTIGHRRSSAAPTDDLHASISQYFRWPRTGTSFPSPYVPQESSETPATLGLPGRASTDLTAFLNTDAASLGSIGDAQYRRQSGVNDESDVTHFKEE